MIYLIEDKTSRRNDYGWNDETCKNHSDVLLCISTVDDIESYESQIMENSNVVLFHESFKDSVRPEKKAYVDSFKKRLEGSSLKVAFFSGGKTYGQIDGNICYLHPHTIYRNLDIFIEKYKKNPNSNYVLKHLMFGKNPEIEEKLHNEIETVINLNAQKDNYPTVYKLFFAIFDDEKLQLFPPFDGTDVCQSYIPNECSDKDFDTFVNDNLSSKKYDLIYIPLCFGKLLSDFLGLRLSLHIRLSDTVNKCTPIVIYGESNIMNFLNHECLEVLKMHGVHYVSGKNESIVKSQEYIGDVNYNDYVADVKTLDMAIPANYGDNHSVANEWGTGILSKIVLGQFSDLNKEKAKENLYFKYLVCKTNLEVGDINSSFAFDKINAKGEHILLIDDETDKGWNTALENIFENARIEACSHKISKYDDLPDVIKDKFNRNYYDLVFLDLRLKGQEENDVLVPKKFSGMDVLRKIKKINEGVQVIMLTASNKAWNMKALLEKADGYYIKESPEYAFPYEYSYNNVLNLCEDIKNCLSVSRNLKSIWESIARIKSIMGSNNLANKYFEDMEVMHGLKYQTLISEELDVVWSLIRSHNNKRTQLSMLSLFKILEFLTEFFYTNDNKGQLCLIDPSYKELMFWDKSGQWYKKGEIVPMYNKRIIKGQLVNYVIKDDLESTTTKVHNIMKYIKIDDKDKSYSYIRNLGFERNGYIHAKNSATKSNTLSIQDIDRWIKAIEKICGNL